jgi:hypothetical protein
MLYKVLLRVEASHLLHKQVSETLLAVTSALLLPAKAPRTLATTVITRETRPV